MPLARHHTRRRYEEPNKQSPSHYNALLVGFGQYHCVERQPQAPVGALLTIEPRHDPDDDPGVVGWFADRRYLRPRRMDRLAPDLEPSRRLVSCDRLAA